MDEMLEVADSENIKVHFFDFSYPLKGIYVAKPNLPIIIGLDNSLKDNFPLLRSIMAEELGHHFTSCGYCLSHRFNNYADRVGICKTENKALRWGAKFLIPDNDLACALQEGINTTKYLAAHFVVTTEIITVRLNMFEKHLSAKRCLYKYKNSLSYGAM